MTKHTITFDLPEDNEDLKSVMQASNLEAVAFEFLHVYLRNLLKQGNLTEDQYEVLEEAQQHFLDLLLEYEVSIP